MSIESEPRSGRAPTPLLQPGAGHAARNGERAGPLSRSVAELTAALDAERDASRAKSLFLSGLGHELRTPLNAIIGYSEMLIDEAQADGEASREQDLARIRDSGRQLLELIDRVVEIARIEAGRMQLVSEDIAIGPFIDEIAQRFRDQLLAGGNRLRVEVAPSAGRMSVDAGKLRRVLNELLSNAGRFCRNGAVGLEVRRPDGAVPGEPLGGVESGDRVDGARPDDRVEFIVSDDGACVAPSQPASLFDPFSRKDATPPRCSGSAGLGLMLASRLVTAMDGSIAVASTSDGATCFTVSLPASSLSHGKGTAMDDIGVDS